MKVVEYNVDVNKNVDDKKIAVVSNVKLSSDTRNKFTRNILDTLAEIKPTEIVIPGNLYVQDNVTLGGTKSSRKIEVTTKQCITLKRGRVVKNELRNYYTEYPTEEVQIKDPVSDFVKSMSDIAKVYYVRGNKEGQCNLPQGLEYNRNKNFNLLCQLNYQFLNTNRTFNDIYEGSGVTIQGFSPLNSFYSKENNEKLKQLLSFYKTELTKLKEQCHDDKVNILLSNDPTVVEAKDLLEDNFDLIISGSNDSYQSGIYQDNNQTLIVSDGVRKTNTDSTIKNALDTAKNGTIEVVNISGKQKVKTR